ncbi:histidinol-phosphate transaminase [Pseudomonas sp. 15FMM2]|uniref:Histidinol-phosphate transaminase n=1 Tax=Pseudomonas imrae TaxID=2992837 RepID=A0ACC7PHW5_9PSED
MKPEHVPSIIEALIRPNIRRLPLYDPGADAQQVALRPGVHAVAKLSNCENPLGISPAAAQVIAGHGGQGLERYPDPTGQALRQLLGERLDVDPSRLVLGNGSENILELLCLALLDPADRVVTQQPCFSLHESLPLMMGAQVDKVPLNDDFSFNLDAWAKALALPAKMLMLSTPSNPVGTSLSTAQLSALVAAARPDTLLVIDEAYFEFTEDSADALAILAAQSRPWIVLRTFSKAYGLAGLRVGYGIASDARLIEALHRVRTPYNVNQLAQDAARAALLDCAHVARSRAFVITERQRLSQALRAAGFRVAPSQANFLFVDTGCNALQVVEELLKDGIIVKAWREPGYTRFIRVSIGLEPQNECFLASLQRAVAVFSPAQRSS